MNRGRENTSYKPVNWQNHNRLLTHEEFSEIERRVSGLHFAKEVFINDPVSAQLLYAAEALLRHVRVSVEKCPLIDEIDV